MSIESNEELGYVSLVRPFGTPQEDQNPDLEDLSALARVLELIDDKITFRNSNDSLVARDSKFTVDEQLAINQQLVADMRELKLLIETAIEQAKEV